MKLLLTALLLMTCCLHAQQTDQVSLSFRIITWDSDIDGVYFKDGTNYIEIQAIASQISHTYTYQGIGDMHLYRKTKIDNSADEGYEFIGKININRGLTEALLILFDAGKSKRDSIRGLFYPASASEFSNNPLIIYNFTKHKSMIKLGDTMIELDPWDSYAVKSDKAEKSSTLLCKIASNTNNEWKLIYNNFLNLSPGVQVYFFITSEENTGSNGKRFTFQTKKILNYNISDELRESYLNAEWSKDPTR
ncbi:hypothetical protein [Cerasicoccus maritimus]|uniref:hypothetical protein n=1 Tax=Cerasicoccus maritimus TaxID=490089 RepID=UPI00285286A6|nr:hypothetical protein [Cerasicoccus maritimus]